MTTPPNARALLAAIAAAAILVTSCGVERDAQVPGLAPVNAPVTASDAIADTAQVPGSDTLPPSPLPPPTILGTTPPLPSASSTAPPSATDPSSTTDPTTSSTDPTTSDESQSTDSQGATPAATGWAAFDQHLTTILDAGSTAVSATVLRDGAVIHEVALGQRTSSGDPVEVGDRYRIASISKVVTSITVLRLMERGEIALDDPVGARLAALAGVSSPAAGVDQITVRNLLTHRSGIGQYEDLMFRRQVESCDQAAATGLSRDLERPPGTTLRYSNLNFCLLGLLIEDVTGRQYEDVVREELLAPLGVDAMRMVGTFEVGDDDVEHRSDEGRNYMEVLGGAGGWVATPTEIATIIDSLDLTTPGWKPLGPDTVAAMRAITEDPPLTAEQAATTSSTIEPPGPVTRGYGMGLMIFGEDSFGHTGTLESTHAMTARQADGITWAITVSGDYPSSTRDLAGIVAEALRLAAPA